MKNEKCKYKINFFTYANDKYYFYVSIYIYFILQSNEDCHVEIIVESERDFFYKYKKQIDYLDEKFPKRFKVRQSIYTNKINPNIVRFVEEPEMKNFDYVYIGDIDIFIVDNDVFDQHISKIKKYNLPFSNIIRKNVKEHLSGLHFCKKDVMYPLPPLDNNIIYFNDEHYLYQLMKNKGFMVPDEYNFRPTHGIHASMNRPLVSRNNYPDWEIKKYKEGFKKIVESIEFKNFYTQLDISQKNLLNLIENEVFNNMKEFKDALFNALYKNYGSRVKLKNKIIKYLMGLK
jgi:hypothetical protein